MYRSVSQLSNTPNHDLAPGLSPVGEPPRRRAAALAIASVFSLACAHASAQTSAQTEVAADPQTTPAASSRDAMDVVTVSATRRREPLRDVPLRVETLSVERLESSGAASLSDYVGTLPGVHVSSDGGPRTRPGQYPWRLGRQHERTDRRHLC
jgi:iron complex outermembrane receptor protein